jgi:hypothetical protein
MKITTMKQLETIFANAIEDDSSAVFVEVTIPNQNYTEFIVNKLESLENKLAYYKNTYTQDLVHSKCDAIKIISAGVTDYKFW